MSKNKGDSIWQVKATVKFYQSNARRKMRKVLR